MDVLAAVLYQLMNPKHFAEHPNSGFLNFLISEIRNGDLTNDQLRKLDESYVDRRNYLGATVMLLIQTIDRRIFLLGLAISLLLFSVAAVTAADTDAEKVQTEQGHFTAADGVRLFYRKLGRGRDFIVFLHGGPGLSMGDGGYAMRPLAERHTLILYDQRGGGRSDLVKDPALLTADAGVRDLEALRQHFGIQKMSLIGLSWGSGLAALYAVAHPEAVSRIVFLDPMPIALNPYAKERGQKIASLMKSADTARLKELVKRSKTATDEELNAICKEETRIIFGPYLSNPDGHDHDWSEMCDVPVPAMRNAPIVDKAVTGSLGDFDLRPTLAKLEMPALVVEGEKTNVPLDSTQEWAKAIPNARLLLIPDAGHAAFIDQPENLLREIEVFVQGAWPAKSKVFGK
jgi:proline iminopeptidase